MKRLVCEMCGGTDLIKQDGVFVCQSCGCKYSVEEARKMMVEVEGTIDVSGSTVKVDTSKRLENLYILARRARDNNNVQDAAKYYYEIRLEDPNSWEAAFYGAYFTALDCKIGQIGPAARTLAESLDTIALLIIGHVPQEEKKQAYTEMLTRANFAGRVLYSGAKNHYEESRYSDAESDFIERTGQCLGLMMLSGKIAEDYFQDYALAKNLYVDSADALRSHPKTRAIATLCDEAIEGLRPKLRAAFQKKNEEKKQTATVESYKKSEDKKLPIQSTLAAGVTHTVGIGADGLLVTTGNNGCGQCHVFDWCDIVAIAASHHHTVGLRSNGTVVAAGDKADNRCSVENWTNIVSVAANFWHTVGLRSDGTVVAVGRNYDGMCDVGGWTNIVAIAAGNGHTVGLHSDGTVVATGGNNKGQCDVSSWRDIVAIAARMDHTVGLRSDGTVVATGSNTVGQCNVSTWRNIIAIAAGEWHTVGLCADGTVVAVGDEYGKLDDVRNWRDIIAIDAGGFNTIGLHSDGSVVATGTNDDGEINVSDWKLLVSKEMLEKLNEKKRAILKVKPVSLKRERTGLLDEQTKLQVELPTLKGLFSGGRRKQIEARLAEIPTRLAEIDSELARLEKELAELG